MENKFVVHIQMKVPNIKHKGQPLKKFLGKSIEFPVDILMMKHIFKKDLLDLGGLFIKPLATQLKGDVKYWEFSKTVTIHIELPFQQVTIMQEKEEENMSEQIGSVEDNASSIEEKSRQIDFMNMDLTYSRRKINGLLYQWSKPSKQRLKQVQTKFKNKGAELENIISKTVDGLEFNSANIQQKKEKMLKNAHLRNEQYQLKLIRKMKAEREKTKERMLNSKKRKKEGKLNNEITMESKLKQIHSHHQIKKAEVDKNQIFQQLQWYVISKYNREKQDKLKEQKQKKKKKRTKS